MKESDNNQHSFAILAHGKSPHLVECIESLLRQKPISLVYLSTSTPSTFLEKISEKYGINLFVNEQSSGIASDWSFAMHQATTQYVTLAHQDDVYLKGYTSSCLNMAKLFPENLIIFTDYAELQDGVMRILNLTLLVKKIILGGVYLFKPNLRYPSSKKILLALGNPISCPSVMYHKGKLQQFSFSENFTVNLDWDAWLRLSSQAGDFVYLRRKLLLHRIHPESETSKAIFEKRRITEDRLLFERIWGSAFAPLIARLYSLSYKSNK